MAKKTDKEKEMDKLMAKHDKISERCDTLPECEDQQGCPTCETKKQLDDLDGQIENLEREINPELYSEGENEPEPEE